MSSPARLATLILSASIVLAAAGSQAISKPEPAAPAALPPAEAPAVRPESVPATGEQAVDIQVPRFGRYAIMAVGGSGTELTLVDRVSGPIATDGVPGERQGRINAILDAGPYRARLRSPEDGLGAVRIELRPYAEQHTSPPELLDGLTQESALRDLEERSWWVVVDKSEPVFLDAAGRSLVDLRLWRDGRWPVDVAPSCEEIRQASGDPVGRCTIATRLEPATYLLTATGGPARPRGDGDGAEPLWVRRGVTKLAEGSRLPRVLSPFGLDRTVVEYGGRAHLSLGSPGAVTLDSRILRGDGPAPYTSGRASVPADAREARTTLELGTSRSLLTVRGQPGQPYALQVVQPAAASTQLKGGTPTWLATVPAGDPGDELDLTGILLTGKPLAITAASAVEVAAGRPYRRRFNLRGPSELYLDVQTAGPWRIEAKGATLRLAPPSLGPAVPSQRRPEPARDTLRADLPAGLQLLEISPEEPGLIELQVHAEGEAAPAELSPPRVAVRLPEVRVPRGEEGTLRLARVAGLSAMLVQRPLPLAPEAPLPLVLGPGERLDLQYLTKRGAKLEVDAPEVTLSVAGAAPGRSVGLSKGFHTLTVHNTSERAVTAVIGPPDEAPRASAPSPSEEDPLPQLTAAEAVFDDIEEGGRRSWRVSIPEAGAWRIESTGLLALEASLRDRAGVVRARGHQNGPGRNARLDATLPAGQAVLELSASGESEGRYGLRLLRLPLEDGGLLRPDLPARAELAAGTTLRLRVQVDQPGRYALQAEVPGQDPSLTLADADGWPLLPPGTSLDEVALKAGTYQLSLAPLPMDAQVRASLRRLDPAPARQGHGPFALALNTTERHVWWEPAQEGATRAPDVWTFALKAEVDVRVRLGAGMEGRLVPESGAAIEGVADGWKGRLKAGDWRLELRADQPDSGLPYAVAVEPTALVAGGKLSLSAPGSVPVVVGRAGVYALSSHASADVRATLLDADGAVVLLADDRPGGWDFARAARLVPGAYRLVVRPVGRGRVPVRLEMRHLEPADRGEARPGTQALTPDAAGAAWRVDLPEGALLVAAAESAENLGIGLDDGDVELSADQGTRPWVAARGPARLTLRLWSLDERGLEATLRVAIGRPRPGEDALDLGEGGPAFALAEGRGDTLRLPALEGLRVCASPGSACVPVSARAIIPAEAPIWAVAPHLKGQKTGLRLTSAPLAGGLLAEALPGAVLRVGGRRGYALVSASASAELPLLGCADHTCWPDATPEGAGGRSALLVPAGAGVSLARSTDSRDPLPIHLELRRFEEVDERPLSSQRDAGVLSTGHAVRLRADRTPVQVLLGPELVLAATSASGTDTLTAPAEGLVLTLMDASEFVIVNPSGQARPWSVRPAEVDQGRADLWAWLADAAGTVLLHPKGPGRLSLGGAAVYATVLSGGQARTGSTGLDLHEGTTSVRVRHEAGPLALWTEPWEAGSTWLRWEAREPVALSGRSGRVPLSGEAVTVVLAPGGPEPVSVVAPGAAGLVLTGPDGRSQLVFPDSTGRSDLMVQVPGTRVTFRSLGGAPLWGEAIFSPIPVEAQGADGEGRPAFLAPGDRVAWRIDLSEPTTLALGVKAEPETARMVVFGADGARLAEGVVARLEAAAGPLWMVVSADPAGGPVSARPLVYGREKRTEPAPADVVRGYAAQDGRIPAPPPEAAQGWETDDDNWEPELGEDTGEPDTGSYQ